MADVKPPIYNVVTLQGSGFADCKYDDERWALKFPQTLFITLLKSETLLLSESFNLMFIFRVL